MPIYAIHDQEMNRDLKTSLAVYTVFALVLGVTVLLVDDPVQRAAKEAIEERNRAKTQQALPDVTANRVQLVEPPATVAALPTLISGHALHSSVLAFLAQAGNMTREQVSCRLYDVNQAFDFTQQVLKLTDELAVATDAYDTEVERCKDVVIRAGQVKDFADEATYRKELAKPVAIGSYNIPIEGEEDAPDGTPHRFYRLATVALLDYPALQQTIAYLSGFDEWRSVLRARAAGLLSLSHMEGAK